MKIGIMGGSFDPVHYGHLILAEQMINEASLDKVIFLPMCEALNKAHEMKASAKDRLKLLKLASNKNDKFEVSDINTRRNRPGYFYEDYEEFEAMYPNDELYVIVGQDSFMRIEKWTNHETLLKKCHFLIGQRPGESTKALFGYFKELFSKYKGIQADFFEIPEMDVSSYTIQNKIRVGKSVRYLMPKKCIEYIESNNLYESLIPKLKAFVKSNVKESRYKHTEGVVDTARKLAVRYDVDVKKAETAAWFHDAFRSAGNLEHGPLAAKKIQEMFGVYDPEIIDAIKNHTTGHPGMSKLDKVIYIADSLEPSRDFPMVDELRKIMYVDLDECLYQLMTHTRDYVLSIGSTFSPISDLAIAELKEKLGK